MACAKKKTFLFQGLLVILALLIQPVAGDACGQLDESDDENPRTKRTATSVVTGPIITLTSVQDRPGRIVRRRIGGKNDKTPLDAARVRKSVLRGVGYLKEKQQADGSWKDSTNYEGGTTGLCALALLNADELPPDPYQNAPRIKKAIEFLNDLPASDTYVVALRVMVLAAADPNGKKHLRQIQSDVKWLVESQLDEGNRGGGWSYGSRRKGMGDSSNTQFALLALHEASKMGVKVPQKTWQDAQDYWAACFNKKTGGFSYSANGHALGSMTCAGIASVIITSENLANARTLVNGNFANCCVVDEMQPVVDAGFDWLSKHYTVRANPYVNRQDDTTQFYYLYGLERAGRLAGKRFVGDNDWYRDGVKELLRIQHPNNDNWTGRGGHGESDPLISSALALLFLSKGKRPVVIGKYNHGAADWDLHPKGVHYLTRRLEKEWNVKLNWQEVKAKDATVDNLLETPVLFMSGKDALELNQAQRDTLKKYLENGGFLFAEACQGDGCGDNKVYHQAFIDLMAEIFPESEFEPLPRNHPIWNSHFPLIGQNGANADRPLFAIQACCRTSVVYCPKNLSCYWNLDRPAIHDDMGINAKLKQRVDYCTKIGVNVVAYATDRANLKDKGDTPTLAEKKFELLSDRVLIFPKLQHTGGSDDAPNAWRNVLKNVSRLGLEIKMDKKMVPADMNQLADYPFLFIHGRNEFKLTEEERKALAEHLEFGGFIFADSICASKTFTDSFRKEMNAVLQMSGTKLEPIPPDHKIWSEQFDAYAIHKVKLRIKTPGGVFQEETRRPELEGANINGRLAVVFSPIDLSCALENSAKSQCTGYTHGDAIKICTNVIMYSLRGE